MSITDARKEVFDFSAPYFDAQQLIAVKEDSKVAKFEDLKTLKERTTAAEESCARKPIRSAGASLPMKKSKKNCRQAGHQPTASACNA